MLPPLSSGRPLKHYDDCTPKHQQRFDDIQYIIMFLRLLREAKESLLANDERGIWKALFEGSPSSLELDHLLKNIRTVRDTIPERSPLRSSYGKELFEGEHLEGPFIYNRFSNIIHCQCIGYFRKSCP